MTIFSLLRAAARTPQPWKNGGGTTSDIAVFPPGATLDDFDWRLSLAEMARAAPFSLFPGVDRHLAVLEGKLELRFDGPLPALHATSGGEPLTFRGDQAAIGHPVGGAVTNLNLMLRRDRCRGTLRRVRGADFTTDAQVTIVVAEASCRIGIDGTECLLDRHDAILIQPGADVATNGHAFLVAEID